MIHKKVALFVHHAMSKDMAKLHRISNAFGVYNVIRRLSGKHHIIRFHADSIGLNYGLPKATASDNYARCQDIVPSSLKVSKITGSDKHPKNAWNTTISNTLSMMPHIFIRMAVY